MSFPVARLGDTCSHGAVIVTAANSVQVNGKQVARIGDLVSCPLEGHGVNPIISVRPDMTTEGMFTGHLSATAACGAVIVVGSSDTYRA